MEGSMNLPIGAIIAWHKNLTGVPALPAGWVECNGGTLDNPDSPLHGQAIPNLNGDKRFLRGDTNSGSLQTDAMQGHRHNFLYSVGTRNSGTYDTYAKNSAIQQSGAVFDPITDGVNGTPRVADETRPINMSVVWIMKVSDTERESRLIPAEDEDIHVDVITQPPTNGGSYGRIGVFGIPVTQFGMDGEGVPYKGVVPVKCLRVGKLTYDSQGAATASGITEADGLKVNLSYGLLTKRLGKPFAFAGATFYTYDEANDEWDAIDAQKFEVSQKVFAGGPSTAYAGAQLWIKGADPGEYVTIGVVQP
jgi:hypothetical protein